MKTFDPQTTLELEAAAFRRLVDHLRSRPDVQNIDMMNLAGFCRNCLSGWMADAAKDRGLERHRAAIFKRASNPESIAHIRDVKVFARQIPWDCSAGRLAAHRLGR